MNVLKNIHGGVRFNCDTCDFKTTQQCNLNDHKKAIHKGVKYNCDQCEFKSTGRGH